MAGLVGTVGRPDWKFEGKRVLITGGASGIGAATASLFAEAKARVAVLDRDLANLPKGEGSMLALQADVGNESQMESAFHSIHSTWDGLDYAVINAGTNGVWAPIADLKAEEWDFTIRVNLRGTFLTAKFAVPLMPAGGAIVIVSSINGTRTFTNSGATAYAASKAAQVAISKMLAVELAPKRLRVNVVCPGATETAIEQTTERRNLEGIGFPVEFPRGDVPLTDGGKATALQVADAILFLCSDAALHVTGEELFIDGGQSLIL